MTVDRLVPGARADRVSVHNQQGAYNAVRHLIELGHRRIACISGPAEFEVARERIEGWRRALQEAGVRPEAHWIIESDFSSPGGYDAARRLLMAQAQPAAGADAPFTGICASNDMMAIGALRAAAELGLRVPQQLSVVGFDDIELSRYVFPALTTVGCSIKELGHEAGRVLIERIENPGAALKDVLLTPRLVVRESTAALTRRWSPPDFDFGRTQDDSSTQRDRGRQPQHRHAGAFRAPAGAGRNLGGRSLCDDPGRQGRQPGCGCGPPGRPHGVFVPRRHPPVRQRFAAGAGRRGHRLPRRASRPASSAGIAVIMVASRDGENSIVYVPGSNAQLSAADVQAARAQLQASAVVVAQLEVPVPAIQAAFEIARAAGAITVLNAAPALAVPAELLALSDWLVVNETEALLMGGGEASMEVSAAAECLRARGPAQVLVSLGAKGALLCNAEGQVLLPAQAVKAVETVGAGDTLVGGLAAALAEGQGAQAAVRLGQAAAALAVSRPGVQDAMPRRAELGAALRRAETNQ